MAKVSVRVTNGRGSVRVEDNDGIVRKIAQKDSSKTVQNEAELIDIAKKLWDNTKV